MTARRLSSTTAIIQIRNRRPGAKKKPAKGMVAVTSVQDPGEGDPEAASMTMGAKALLAPEYRAIVAFDNGTRQFMRQVALPARMLSGSYLVPVTLIEKVYDRLGERAIERSILVGAFVAAYPAIVADAVVRLKDAFDTKMFPGSFRGPDGAVQLDDQAGGAVRAAFSMDYTLEVADKEAGIRAAGDALSPAFVERELRKAKEAGEAMLNDVRDGMRLGLADLVENAVEMLKPGEGEDGKRKAFRGERLVKIQEFLRTFQAKDVAGDTDLQAVVAKARAVLDGVSVDELREAKDKSPREAIGKALAGIQAELAPMVVNAGANKRRIKLDDEAA